MRKGSNVFRGLRPVGEADEDFVAVDADLVGSGGGVGGALGGAVLQAEAPAVDGADDVGAIEGACGEGGSLVGAGVVDGVGDSAEDADAEGDGAVRKAFMVDSAGKSLRLQSFTIKIGAS